MFCGECGLEARDESGARSCARCGAPLPIVAGGTLARQVVAGEVVAEEPPPDPPMPPSEPDADPPQGPRWVAIGVVAAALVLGIGASAGVWVLQDRRPQAVKAGVAASASSARQAGDAALAGPANPAQAGPDPAEIEGLEILARVVTVHAGWVVKLTVVGCGDERAFNGVVVGPDLVATANQLLDETVAVGVDSGQGRLGAVIIGRDGASGVGLVRTSAPIKGKPALFSVTKLKPGLVVAGVGTPTSDPSVAPGWVGATDASYEMGDDTHHDTIEVVTDGRHTASGSALVDERGRVLGLVTGTNAKKPDLMVALPWDPIEAAIDRMRGNTESIKPTVTCKTPLGPTGTSENLITVPNVVNDRDGRSVTLGATAQALADPLSTYFRGINEGKQAQSMSVMSDSLRSTMTLESFTEGTRTSYDSDFVVTAVRASGDAYVVSLRFVSLQDAAKGPDGKTCNRWTIDYTLVRSGGGYVIDGAEGTNGTAFHDC